MHPTNFVVKWKFDCGHFGFEGFEIDCRNHVSRRRDFTYESPNFGAGSHSESQCHCSSHVDVASLGVRHFTLKKIESNSPENRSGLGPRIIPTFRTIIKECTSVLQENLDNKKGEYAADSMNPACN